MKQELDNRLREWSQRHTPGAEHLAQMASRIVETAVRNRYQDSQVRAAHRISLGVKFGYALAGAVLAIVGFMVCTARYQPSVSAGPSAPGLAQLVTPTASQLETIGRLFQETARLFPRQLRWITQSNGDVALGVESDESSPVPDTQPMLVRLVMVKRAVGEKEWIRAWSTDVVLRGEDLVEVTPSRQWNNKLTMWVYPLDNGKVAVDTSITLVKPSVVSARIDTVVALGESVEVAHVVNGHEEMKVFQIIEPLCAPKRNST